MDGIKNAMPVQQQVPMVRMVNPMYMPMQGQYMHPGGYQVQQTMQAATPQQQQPMMQFQRGAQPAQQLHAVQQQQQQALQQPAFQQQAQMLPQQHQQQQLSQQQQQQQQQLHHMEVIDSEHTDIRIPEGPHQKPPINPAAYPPRHRSGVRSISPPPGAETLQKAAVPRVSTAPLGSRIEEEEKLNKKDKSGKEDELLLPGIPTSDKPTCKHNKWILMTKKKRFYIMKCMVCTLLWKTKLKSTRKCAEFFAGNCPMDDRCPHPHVYSRSRLRRLAEENPGILDHEGVLVNIEEHEEEDEEPTLFIPMTLEDRTPAKLEKRPPTIPYTQNQGQPDACQVISSMTSSDRAVIKPTLVSSPAMNQTLIVGMLIELEHSKRQVLGMQWWCGLVRMADIKEDIPLWLEFKEPEVVPCVPDATTHSSMRSSRILKWKLSTNHSGATAFTEISGRTEPPDLEEGEYLPYLIDSACLSEDPEQVFTVLAHQVGQGSFAPLYPIRVKNFSKLIQSVTDSSVANWLHHQNSSPLLTAQIIELHKITPSSEEGMLRELQCLHEIRGSEHLPRLIRTFAMKDLWVVTDSGFDSSQLDTKQYVLADILAASKGSLESSKAVKAILHISRGLAHMAAAGWLHLNINTRSILYNEVTDSWKLSSLRSVLPCALHDVYRPAPPSEMSLIVYTPSEHHGASGFCSHKSDVFSLGVTGTRMLGMQSHDEHPSDPTKASIFALCKSMTSFQASDRPTAEAVTHSPVFSGL
eukprot:TRINITY_DN2107_c4_g1_i1.p1 TRINITY_DN2107_c4_g1~~TRINITY_DN2107_c4_g1_i1.p1  ORF type:complete len:750 (+),score=124.95 TRINITY_DN2107_c4_g1_i1:108-2357(+)